MLPGKANPDDFVELCLWISETKTGPQFIPLKISPNILIHNHFPSSVR